MLASKKNVIVAILCLVLLLSALAALYARRRPENALASKSQPSAARMAAFPKLFLWAWERPEHLEFINPQEVGVAFLAETIYLRGERIIERPRLQPLKVPAGTTLISVVRLESARDEPPALSDEQRARLVEALKRIATRRGVAALQIDFDASESEREFYQLLIRDARKALPETMPLSITALASWCIFDNWLDDLPLDEAVPMLFDMGVDQQRITNYLSSGGSLRASLCRSSVGVSLAEKTASLSSNTRVYFFNTEPWSETTVRQAIERIRK